MSQAALDEEERVALYNDLMARARVDPTTWCEVASHGQWFPYLHARLIVERLHQNCIAGRRTIVSVSVGTGKTTTLDLILAWWKGAHPDEGIIGGAAGQQLANRNSKEVRDYLTEWGPQVFGVSVDQSSRAMDQWNVVGHRGGFKAVGRGSSPEGFRGNVAIDDPFGSFKDAMSPTSRREARDWWQASLRPRMDPGAWAILTVSRWHEEDLSGWLRKEFGEEWDEIRMPALCDDPDHDPMGRDEGESIWPERWTLEALAQARRETISEGGEITWSARYQQRPLSMAAKMFPQDKWVPVSSMDDPLLAGATVVSRARGWDLAASEATGDWTVGVLLGGLSDGRWLVEDIVRVQAGPDGVRELLRETASADRARTGPMTTQVIPQDPGQAGKDQSTQLVRLVAPSPVVSKPVSGAKEVRAAGYASQQRLGQILVMDGPHVLPFRACHSTFPGGEHDDDVDAGADAFNQLAGGVAVVDAGSQSAYAGLTRSGGLG